MKKALITGITGQDGSYLAEFLLEKGYTVYGLQRRASTFNTGRINHLLSSKFHPDLFETYYGDLTDSSSISRLIEKLQPDEIYNLGAQSHVKVSFEIPEFTCEATGLGTLRILDSIRELRVNTKFYQASSSEMFGKVQEIPQKENTPFYPRSPYGCAKVFSYWITVNYRESYNLFACNGILFNHESPRRGETFVTRKITQALSKIKLGKQEKLLLGNLDAKRDWGYAKDYVEGMWMMLQKDQPGDYVLSTGETHSVREFIEEASKLLNFDLVWIGEGLSEKGIDRKTGKEIICVDQKYFRPAEVDILIGDNTKAKRELGWLPRTNFKQLVKIMIDSDFSKECENNATNEVSTTIFPQSFEVSSKDIVVKGGNYSNYTPSIVSEKIMVAGGTGFLGKRIVKKLQELNIPYVVASRNTGVDLRDPVQTDNFFQKEKPSIIMNCAAFVGGIKFGLEHEGEIYYNNTLINLNLFESARKYGIKRIINPIANCSYPDVDNKEFKEEEWWNGPLNRSVLIYGLVKKATWALSSAYRKQYGIDTINLLIPNMYGPGDHFDEVRSHALGALVMKIAKAKIEKIPEVVIWGSGKPIREWLYVDDCAEAFIKALEIPTSDEPINIGRGEGVSITDLAELIKKEINYEGKFTYDTSKPDGAPYKIMNTDRMKSVFNWKPETEIGEGLKKTIEWYQQNMLNKSNSFKIFQMSPYIGEEEIEQMSDSIRKNWITEGPKAGEFVQKVLNYTGAKYGVLANNGTVALYLALKSLGIKEGDEVLVSDFSFYASASSITWAGAKPVFVDITIDNFNIDVSKIEEKITVRTKAIMPIHIYGQSADMDPIIYIAKKYGIKVIEDACQGFGVFYKNQRHTGTIGDVGCFSFFADKTITTGGEGGMVVTNDEKLYEEMKYLRNQGRTKSGSFVHPKFGVNFRLTDLAAGFGLAQFNKLDYIIGRKLENYGWYKEFLSDCEEVEFLKEVEYSNFVPFRVNIKVKRLNELLTFFEQNGIQTRGCFYPLHKQNIYGSFGFKDEDFPNSIYAYENAMSLPVHLALKKEDVQFIAETIKNFYHKK